MYVGQLVELAPTDAVFRQPRHPYTAARMRAVPVPDPRIPSCDGILRGEVPKGAKSRLTTVGMLLPSALRIRPGTMPA